MLNSSVYAFMNQYAYDQCTRDLIKICIYGWIKTRWTAPGEGRWKVNEQNENKRISIWRARLSANKQTNKSKSNGI